MTSNTFDRNLSSAILDSISKWMVTLGIIFCNNKVFCFCSKAKRDKAVAQLNKNLNEVESGLSDAEHRKPVFNEKDSVGLETATKQLQEQRVRDLS